MPHMTTSTTTSLTDEELTASAATVLDAASGYEELSPLPPGEPDEGFADEEVREMLSDGGGATLSEIIDQQRGPKS
ncbi:MAG: hypothetical protein M3R24_12760 [Chloroflexota bacterium]|nr:hypothetical protein [Chloroflexota bacterium]